MDDEAHAKKLLTLETNQEETWIALRQFYVKNRASIEHSQDLDVGKGQFLEDLDQVLQASQVLLDGLVALANIHPIFGVAIFAFHGIIKLDVTRRENNRKVLAVKLQMQSMMSAMFHKSKSPLQELVKAIADEIKQCGSDLNYYSDRKLVSKLIKAKIYERRFAEHVETFAQRRSELQTAITAYISAGIDAANVAINVVGQKVEVVDEKIDSLLAVFRRLDTPTERELLKFMVDNGGVDKCINEDDLLKELMSKAGQAVESISETRKNLRAELSEDLEKVLTRNLSRFENVLEVQNSNLVRLSDQIERQGYGLQNQSMRLDRLFNTSILILEEGKLIRKAVVPNTVVKLKDAELQRIWDRMGLSGRRNVKAKQFVLTLRDYLVAADRSMAATPEPRSALPLVEEGSPQAMSFEAVPDNQASLTVPDNADADAWALKHINVAHVQPIIEAMDEDGSGFINVDEANSFALSRPKGMKLLHWIAYWAAGWHYNLTDYRYKIYRIMQKLHRISQDVLSVNRKMVAEYLDDWDYFRIEGILRHITPVARGERRDPRLAEIASSIAAMQEERLRSNLQALMYVLLPADVALVTGSGRLETWLLPLLYIILGRHLEVFRVAQSRTLHPKEVISHRVTLESIMKMYDDRMQQLRETFRLANRDTEIMFRNFSYGLFLEAYKWTGDRIAKGNTLLSFTDETLGTSEDDLQMDGDESPDISVLFGGPGDAILFATLEDLANNTELAARSESEGGETNSTNVPSDTIASDDGVEAEGSSSDSVANPRTLHGDPHSVASHVDLEVDLAGTTSNDVNSALKKDTSYGVEGPWVVTYDGYYFLSPVACIIQPIVGGAIVGVGRDYFRLLSISGVYDEQTGDVSVIFDCAGYAPVKLMGTYNHSKDTIRGRWAFMTEDSEGSTDSDDPPQVEDRLFAMTRHSVSAFRFRSLLDADGPNLERRRWAFAIEAVLADVQETMGSWNLMRSRVKERNDWIEFHTRRRAPAGIAETRVFWDDEAETRWQYIRNTVYPTTLALYEEMGGYLRERSSYDLGVLFCDVCRQRIIFRRYLCVTCIEDDYSSWVDFCVDNNCSEGQTTFSTTDLIHSSSHSLLRCTETIFTYELPRIVSQARILSERIKQLFRDHALPKDQSLRGDGMKAKDGGMNSVAEPKCFHCGAALTLPCWVCTICPGDMLFCLRCQRSFEVPLKSRGAFPDGHSRRHHLMRINDSAEAKMVRQRTQDKHLHDMDTRMIHGFKDLEHRMDAIEEKLNVRIASLETKVDSLLSLLQKVALQGGEGKSD